MFNEIMVELFWIMILYLWVMIHGFKRSEEKLLFHWTKPWFVNNKRMINTKFKSRTILHPVRTYERVRITKVMIYLLIIPSY